MQALIKTKMKEHVTEAMDKRWKLPEDIDNPTNDNQTTEEPEAIHSADKLADRNVSLKKKMKALESELGRKPVTEKTAATSLD